MSHHTHAERHEYESHEKLYWKIFGILIVLTVVTVLCAQVDLRHYHIGTHNLGWLNIVIAMIVASIKATLVALVFMHLKTEDKLTWVYAAFPLALMVILVGSLYLDEPFRVVPSGILENGKPYIPGEYPEKLDPLMHDGKPVELHGGAAHE